MNEVIYRGLRLVSKKGCRYYEVKEGKLNSLIEDTDSSVLRLTYSPGSTARSVGLSLGIPLVGTGHMDLEPTSGPTRFSRKTITLNGLTLEKLTHGSHAISITIVDDSESRVVQTYDYTTLVISKDDYRNPEFIKFLFYSGNLLYIRPIGPKVGSGWELRNFPKLPINDQTLTSESTAVYTLRRRYNDYLIRGIDYQDQFIIEIRRILDDYGVEFVRLNKERTLEVPSYITYQFNQTPVLVNHPKRRDYDRGIIYYKQPIDFVFHTTDMPLYHDFKSKYLNVNLLTNFTEFRVPDKAGVKWNGVAKWGSITEDFNHVYQPDDNSNFAFQCQFRCELYFYEVLDTRYEFLREIVTRLDAEDKNGDMSEREENSIKDDNL